MTDASAVAGTYRQRGLAWVRQAGGVRPRRGRDLQGRYLSFGEREEIALGRAGGESIRSISRRLGRSPSTISRELARNRGAAGGYRATTAHPLAYERASRPKPAKLVTNVALRARVEARRGSRGDDSPAWLRPRVQHDPASCGGGGRGQVSPSTLTSPGCDSLRRSNGLAELLGPPLWHATQLRRHRATAPRKADSS
jgi:Helix-turn-helix domain